MSSAKVSFLCSEFAKAFFLAKDLATDFNMRPKRKINVGSQKICESKFLFAKNGRLQIKEFRTTAIYIYILYYLIDINMYIYNIHKKYKHV